MGNFNFMSESPNQSAKVVSFAAKMRKIPRKALKCEIYGTITIVVNKAHALNIFRKVFPGIKDHECYQALCLLQELLDN